MAKTALCIGINDYPGTQSDLTGCVNDANDWKAELERRGFSTQQLLDGQATKEAMLGAIQALVRSAASGDLVVITYSGHGSWVPDRDGDEPDARDEVLCPYDIGKNRPLTDDELHDTFAERARGVRIVLISDSCHSGSVIRLAPTPGEATGSQIRFLAPARFLPEEALRSISPRPLRRAAGVSRPFGGVLLSGCQDIEYSYDAVFGGRPNGAFTYFALRALKGLKKGATYRDWHRAIREKLPNPRHPQTPGIQGTRLQKAWTVFEA